MKSNPKKTPRISKTIHVANLDYRDRFSNLPEHIFHYILSYLEIREVIRLSELSRRWRRVWASVPYLNFKQSSFDSVENFRDLLWLVLSSRDVCDIKRFRLSCDGIHQHVLKSPLLAVKNRGVLVLALDIACFHYEFQWLSCFADCRPLPEINLRLVGNLQLYGIDSMSFRMLKTLHIENSDFHQGLVYRKELVLYCPNLENFLLKNCNMLDLEVIAIKAANLKNLNFLNNSFRGELKISAPNLMYLSYLGLDLKRYASQNFSSLNKALILFTERVNNEDHYCPLLSLLSALYNAEVLHLSSHFLQLLSHLPFEEGLCPPTFLRLKSLTLSVGLSRHSKKLLVQLLKYSPILEALRIDFEEKLEDNKRKLQDTKLKDTQQWLKCESSQEMLKQNVTCLTHHLKKVEIKSFVWKKIASKLVKYLLENGKVLKNMTITCQNYGPGNKRFVRMLEFGRASPNVAISFATFFEEKTIMV